MAISYLENDAVISKCGKYRYLLRRVWDQGKPKALIVMLNPSTADARRDDATIRSCVRLLSANGFGSMEVVNLMAWRATKPENIPNKPSMALGAGNVNAIAEAASRADTIVCAWGSHPYALQFAPGVLGIINLEKQVTYCFGKTLTGAPKHPLYIKTGTPLTIFQQDIRQ